MTKNLRVSLAAALLVAAGAASANTLTFDTNSGASFNDTVLVTPTSDNQLSLFVNGGPYQYSALSLSIDGGAAFMPTAGTTSLRISFSDLTNNSYLLQANQTYTLTVSGTVAASFVGKTSSFTISSGNGTLSLPEVVLPTSTPISAPIPEPETWAMLLAGLGFVGVLARRRARKA